VAGATLVGAPLLGEVTPAGATATATAPAVGDLTPTSGRLLGTVNDGNVATTAVFYCYGQGSTFSS